MRRMLFSAGCIHPLAFSPCGRVLASCAGTSGVSLLRFRGPTRGVTESTFHIYGWPSGLALALGDGWFAQEERWRRSVVVRDLRGETRTTFSFPPTDSLGALAVCPGERILAALHVRAQSGAPLVERTVRRWVMPEGRELPELNLNDGASRLVFASEERLLTGGYGALVRVWEPGSGDFLDYFGAPGCAELLAASPDGRTVAVAAGRQGQLWDLLDAESGPTFGHGRAVTALAFHPSGEFLATGGADRTVRFWDVATGAPRGAFDWQIGTITALAFAPDGLTAAVGSESGQVVVWDVV